ncbi:MAG: dTDP-4-dehydrorhamnose 3,5-epimerase [Cytophagales bacterium]|nr:dTDP-4-dehydrorhamnose 3,5-epimerase [Cytophagales bacterium]MDW8385223.1 dTDP-4-dehydrorhamnose 3,5-epimerase [Flammeovirgaceae bacterium]
MKFTETPLKGAWIIEPQVFTDERGYFYESFQLNKFEKATGLRPHFIQDNHSLSYYGVLRGLHLQVGEMAQAKLVRVLSGEVLDVIVDVRKDSATFGQYFSIILSAENKKQLFVPRGFAHGFIVLSPSAEFVYKCDNFYSPQHESGIIYNDSDLNIDWKIPKKDIKISQKDSLLKPLRFSDFGF